MFQVGEIIGRFEKKGFSLKGGFFFSFFFFAIYCSLNCFTF